jgi:hypothetical protein
MPDYVCPDCHKDFKAPCYLKRHLSRKTPCKIAAPGPSLHKTVICIACNRGFTTAQALSRHKKESCRAAAEPAAPCPRNEIAEMRKTLERLLAGAHHTTVNIANVNIVVNVFGEENIRHIGPEQIKSVLDDALAATADPFQGALQAITQTAMMICSDPERPTNLTCYMPNKKYDSVRVKKAIGGWQMQPFAAVNAPLVERSTNVLFANQPFDDAARYGGIMTALRDGESEFKKSKNLRNVFQRNKELVRKAFGTAP